MIPNCDWKPVRTQSGFTLVELIVVVAAVMLLAGIAIPMITGYMDDGRRARAQAETKMLGAAITSFNNDLGVYPARSPAGVNNTMKVLITGPTVPASNPYSSAHQWATWALSSANGDLMDNHMLLNTPGGAAGGAYATTGSSKWRGPYLAGPSPLDPWGRPYIVTVISGYSTDPTNYKRIYVVSAGPNGTIDTGSTATATTDIVGDDIGVIIGQRQ